MEPSTNVLPVDASSPLPFGWLAYLEEIEAWRKLRVGWLRSHAWNRQEGWPWVRSHPWSTGVVVARLELDDGRIADVFEVTFRPGYGFQRFIGVRFDGTGDATLARSVGELDRILGVTP